MALSPEELKDWRVCWRVNAAFSAEADNEQDTACPKCGKDILSGELPYRSSFVLDAIKYFCEHKPVRSLCSDCDMDMVFNITRGKEKCFINGCDKVLLVHSSLVSTGLSELPKLLADYNSIAFSWCIVCQEYNVSAGMPTAASDCTHKANACIECLENMIESNVATNDLDRLKCPHTDCERPMQHQDIKTFSTTATFEAYDQLTLQRALDDTPKFLRCQNPVPCLSGQINYSRGPGWEPKMICAKCRHTSCFECKVTWHLGKTCEEHQASIRSEVNASDEQKSAEYLEKYCKKCPRSGCGLPTLKVEACHEIDCIHDKCKTLWCWSCKVIIDRSAGYKFRCGTGHLTSCDAPKVRTYFISSITKPSDDDGRYRKDWDQDPGFIGTGEEWD